MRSKGLFRIEQKRPLGKWETVEIAEMTSDEATQKCAQLLKGDAFQTRFGECWKDEKVYLPQFLS